jgi:hypothetical protein
LLASERPALPAGRIPEALIVPLLWAWVAGPFTRDGASWVGFSTCDFQSAVVCF